MASIAVLNNQRVNLPNRGLEDYFPLQTGYLQGLCLKVVSICLSSFYVLYGGFLNWGYHKKEMVDTGKSENKMDNLVVPPF
jgi:hypothetical protein